MYLGMILNEVTIAESWTVNTKGVYYSDVDEFDIDWHGLDSWPTLRQVGGCMAVVVGNINIGV